MDVEVGVSEQRGGRWVLEKADWDKFEEITEKSILAIDERQGVDS